MHQGVRAAGVFRDVATDSASFLAGGIGREVQPQVRHVLRKLQVDHAGLHRRALVLNVNLEDAVHPREGNHHAAILRNRAATESGTCATRDHSNLLGRGQPHDPGHLFSILREDNRAGRAFPDASVVLIQHQVFGAIQDGIPTGNLAEGIDEGGQIHSQV